MYCRLMPWTEYDSHVYISYFRMKCQARPFAYACAPRRTPVFFTFASAILVADVPEQYNKKRDETQNENQENNREERRKRRHTRNIKCKRNTSTERRIGEGWWIEAERERSNCTYCACNVPFKCKVDTEYNNSVSRQEEKREKRTETRHLFILTIEAYTHIYARVIVLRRKKEKMEGEARRFRLTRGKNVVISAKRIRIIRRYSAYVYVYTHTTRR